SSHPGAPQHGAGHRSPDDAQEGLRHPPVAQPRGPHAEGTRPQPQPAAPRQRDADDNPRRTVPEDPVARGGDGRGGEGARGRAGIPFEVLFVVVLAAAVAGVWVGAWLSVRLGGGDAARYRATGIGGTVGLVVAIGLAYVSTKFLPGILPLLAILSPGGIATIAANASDPSRRRPATGPDAGAAET